MFSILGGKQCVICGCLDVRCLQFDHINGGGCKESRIMGNKMLKHYINNPEEAKAKLQVLCANCNWIKRYINNETLPPRSTNIMAAKTRINRRLIREKLLCLLGKSCARCGFNDVRCMQVDHKYGGGYAEVKRFKMSVHTMYAYYVKKPEGALQKLQTLCVNCNRIKIYENRELPASRIAILTRFR